MLARGATGIIVMAGAVLLAACSSSSTTPDAKGQASDSGDDASMVATTEHDNNVTFIQGPNTCISTASFAPQDSNITGGQPWSGVSTVEAYNGQTFSLVAKAGRKDSPGPAAWFNAQAPQYLSMFAGPINNLNFAFTGEFTLNGDTYLIALGQGNGGGGSSPWWLGGQGFMAGTDQDWNQLFTPDGKYYLTTEPKPFSPGGSQDDTFYMFATGCP